MEVIITVSGIVLGLIIAFLLVSFSRALAARLTTGKWPHQSEASKKIYDGLI